MHPVIKIANNSHGMVWSEPILQNMWPSDEYVNNSVCKNLSELLKQLKVLIKYK